MQDQTTTVEINGVKFDIDLRSAKRVDTLRIGDRVKCLVKKYGEQKVYPGIVIGFDPFPTLPTIVVAYISESYDSVGLLEFKVFNSESKDFEIVADIDKNSLEINKSTTLIKFDRDIEKANAAVEELKRRREFFLDNFGLYFADASK